MKYFIILVVVLNIVSCTSSSKLIKSNEQLKYEKKAAVIVNNPSFLKGLLLPLGANLNLVIESVDSEKMKKDKWSGYPTEVEINEGEHSVEVGCWGTVDSIIHVSNNYLVKVNVEPGKKYSLTPAFTKNGCIAIVSDVTNK